MTRNQRYTNIVKSYIHAFEKKQNTNFEYWMCDIVGGHAIIGDVVLDFIDIVYDIDNKIEKGKIFEWSSKYLYEEGFVMGYRKYTEI